MSDAYEHVAVLVSFIVSLGFAHVLVGLAALIQSPVKVRVSLPHALWTAVAIASLIDLWLGMYDYRTQAQFALGPLLLILAQSAAGYLMAALVMPSGGYAERLDDLVKFHQQHRRSYMLAFMAFISLDAVVAVVTDPELRDPVEALSIGAMTAAILALPLLALWRRERWIQIGVPALLFVLTTLYWLLAFPVFG